MFLSVAWQSYNDQGQVKTLIHSFAFDIHFMVSFWTQYLIISTIQSNSNLLQMQFY